MKVRKGSKESQERLKIARRVSKESHDRVQKQSGKDPEKF